jgi:hypothetical protein
VEDVGKVRGALAVPGGSLVFASIDSWLKRVYSLEDDELSEIGRVTVPLSVASPSLG